MKRKKVVMSRDGTLRYLHPFHISMEGKETAVFFRDEEDYDAMVKILAVCALRKNVSIVVYVVVSNHCHVVVLAETQKEADDYAEELKRIYSMWFTRKYGRKESLQGLSMKAIWVDSDWYVRNALAYVLRNALDNGCDVFRYEWSGIRAAFADHSKPAGARRVADLSTRQTEKIFHTGHSLREVRWLIDSNGRLLPESFCDYHYLEQAFEKDRTFFLRTVGAQNGAEMKEKLLDGPRRFKTDGELLKIVAECSERWFQAPLDQLSRERKIRLVPYLFRTSKTSVAQLARVFGLSRGEVTDILGLKKS